MIGKVLGKYRIVEKVGQGGQGQVYKAIQEGLDREVAIKVLSANLIKNGEMAARFKQEILICARLQHPNLIKVFDQGHEDGVTYFAMEFFRGISLQDMIKKGGAQPVDMALKIASQALQALHHIHEEGLIHRDVKPSNLLVGSGGMVKLMDFGLARDGKSSALTQTGALLGTLGYLSPEMIRGDAVDLRSDLYQMGVVLFELITGRLPLEQAEVFRVAGGDATVPVPGVRSIRREVSEPVERLLQNTLTLYPGDRYQKAKEMVKDIARAQAGQEVALLPGVVKRRATGKSRRITSKFPPPELPHLAKDAKPDEVFRAIHKARRRGKSGFAGLLMKALLLAAIGWLVVAGLMLWRYWQSGRVSRPAPPAAPVTTPVGR